MPGKEQGKRRGRRDSGSDAGTDSQDTVGTFETLRDEGEHFVQGKLFKKAIESFTKALEMKPEDKNCLVTRSKCWLQLGNAENALTDAEAALGAEDGKDFVRGIFQKAEALYQKGDFETALVFYHRGHKLRPELQEFRLGIQKSQEAINNSIGTPESVKLDAKGEKVREIFYEQEEAEKKKAKKQQRGGTYSKPQTKKKEEKERERPKSSADSKTVKQLLGELYGDKEYLEKLLDDESMTGSKTGTSRDIKNKVCDGLEYLYSRADFWRQQKPMYARKRDKDKMQRSAKSRSRDPASYILKNLEDIDEAQGEGRYEDSLAKAKKTFTHVESMSEDDLQNKQEILANLHSQIGNAYLELGKYNQAEDHHKKDLEIAKEHDMEDAKSRALDNLGRVHARKGDFEKAVEIWEEKLPLSKSALESTWLYHEIGRCHLEIGKYGEARDYGEKSLAAAREADDDGWQLHACVLVAQSEVKLGDYQAASESFDRSLEMAKKQNDAQAEHAIKKALEEVNQSIVRGEKDGEGQDEERPRSGGSVRSGGSAGGRKSGAEDYEDDFEEGQKEAERKVEVEADGEDKEDQHGKAKGHDDKDDKEHHEKGKGHDKADSEDEKDKDTEKKAVKQ